MFNFKNIILGLEIYFKENYKFQHTKEELINWLAKKKATKRQVLSLVGLLHHAAEVKNHGRSFVSRMCVTTAKVKELDYFTRLNMDFHADLLWRHTFMNTWNGHSLFRWHMTVQTYPHRCIWNTRL